jgi:hypothetical protein
MKIPDGDKKNRCAAVSSDQGEGNKIIGGKVGLEKARVLERGLSWLLPGAVFLCGWPAGDGIAGADFP